jgi:hypothetical protein
MSQFVGQLEMASQDRGQRGGVVSNDGQSAASLRTVQSKAADDDDLARQIGEAAHHVTNLKLSNCWDLANELLRGPNGAKDEFLLAATAQNLRKLAKLIIPTMPQRLATA